MTHVPTEEQRAMVATCSGMGLRHEQISILVGITEKTLRRKYRAELDTGRAKAHFNIGKTVYENALKGDRTLLIWYTKTQMGWRETLQLATPLGEKVDLGVAGEAELIGAYYARLAKIAAERDPDPDPRKRMGAAGQEADGPEGGREAGEG